MGRLRANRYHHACISKALIAYLRKKEVPNPNNNAQNDDPDA
jgi:hypothetical protein